MTVKFGFYDSLNGDRLYNANDISTMFEGMFSDGIFELVGDKFEVVNDPGQMGVLVKTGRAWFSNSWIRNTSVLPLVIQPSSLVYDRIDLVILEFNSDITVRENSIKVLTGTPAAIPIPPVLSNTSTLKQYALAQILIPATSSTVLLTNITNKVGSPSTPYSYVIPISPLSEERNKGYIRELSSKLVFDSVNSYHVEPGAADINGSIITWDSNINRSGLSLLANTLYNVYLYNNNGTASIEESTTNPIWDSSLLYMKKTGDATRRWVGYFSTDASNNIRKFLHSLIGNRMSEIIFIDGVLTGRQPVSNVVSETSWTPFSLSPLVPIHATHVNLLRKLIFTVVGQDLFLALSPIDLGSGVIANLAPDYIRAHAGSIAAAGSGNIFFGSSWNAISISNTYYYRTWQYQGTPLATIEIHGSRFSR